MDHHNSSPAKPPPPRGNRRLDKDPFVSLAKALTWIAFGDPMTDDQLRTQVQGHRAPDMRSPDERLEAFFSGQNQTTPEGPGIGHFHDRKSGIERLNKAWSRLRKAVERGTVKVRGRFTPAYSVAEASMSDVVDMAGNVLATFSQFDVSTGGIRRQPHGSPDVLWSDHPQGFEREFGASAHGGHAGDGYLVVEVGRAGLVRALSHRTDGTTAANRQLDHKAIVQQAIAMRAGRPGLTKGSAAASIVADLPPNPKTGKSRDTRHIERMIEHLWEGGF